MNKRHEPNVPIQLEVLIGNPYDPLPRPFCTKCQKPVPFMQVETITEGAETVCKVVIRCHSRQFNWEASPSMRSVWAGPIPTV